MIKPTIGRVVWFYPSGYTAGQQPNAALIAYVHSDSCINLGAVDADGKPFSACSVTLLQEGDPTPTEGYYATWMPFQIGQAKIHAAAAEPVSGAIDDRADEINGDVSRQRDDDAPKS